MKVGINQAGYLEAEINQILNCVGIYILSMQYLFLFSRIARIGIFRLRNAIFQNFKLSSI